jgi:hypothetical protein
MIFITCNEISMQLAEVTDILAVQHTILLGRKSKLFDIRQTKSICILNGQNINLPGF